MQKYWLSLKLFISGLIYPVNHTEENHKMICEINDFKEKDQIEKLIIFGDSLSDIGAFYGAANQLVENKVINFIGNLKFNKIEMTAPFFNNCCSNGQVFTKILANKLNLSLTPAWKFKIFKLFSFEQKGNNYAVAGAQAVKRNDELGRFLNYFTIDNQINAFLKQHLKIKTKEKIIFEIGANDIMYALEKYDENKIDAVDIVVQSVTNQAQAIRKLIKHGARDIIVCSLPALEFLPAYNKNSTQIKNLEKLIKIYNHNWWHEMAKLNAENLNLLKVFDLNTEMKNSFSWFKKTAEATNIIDPATITNYDFISQNGILQPEYNFGVNESNINNWFFFDHWHPSALIHEHFAEIIYNNFF